MITNCPGAERFKQPVPENVTCPRCRKELEIWSDEPNGPYGYSVPKERLWQGGFTHEGSQNSGRFTWREYSEVVGDPKAGYYNPLYYPNYSADNDRKIYQYNFDLRTLPSEWFEQFIVRLK